MASTSFGLQTWRSGSQEEEGGPPSIDIIATHGLYGSQDSGWADIKWRHGILPAIPDGSRLSIYTYDVFGLDGGLLTREGATQEATRFLDAILELRSKDGTESIAITFIGQDLGGTLIKEAIALSQQQKYRHIFESIALLIFFGCPHRGSKLELQAGCSEILMSHETIPFPQAWEFATSSAEWIIHTNNSFAETRMPILALTYNLGSFHPDVRKKVFSQFVTSSDGAGAFLESVTHRDLLKTLIEPTLGTLRVHLEEQKLPGDSSVFAYQARFLQHTPPQHPPDIPPPSEGMKSGWSSTRQDVQDWMLTDDNLRLIHATTDYANTAAGNIYELLLSLYNDPLGSVHGSVRLFLFDPTDCRSSSAEAMLCSALAHVYKSIASQEGRKTVRDAVASLSLCRGHHVEDLYAVLMDILLTRLATFCNRGSPIVTTLVIGNLDGRVHNGAWLFRRLRDTVSDCKLGLKVIITSSDPDSLVPGPDLGATMLATGWERVIQDLGAKEGIPSDRCVTSESTNGPTRLIKEILALIQSRPRLYHYSSDLHQIAMACKNNTKLWDTITSFLQGIQASTEAKELKTMLSQLASPMITPEKVFRLMLTSTAPRTHARCTLLLERIIFAFRPLKLSELLDLELFNSDSSSATLAEDPTLCAASVKAATQRVGGGLLVVIHDEVRLGHSALRDYLLTSTDDVLGGWLPLGPKAPEIHRKMAESCLNYLSSPGRRQMMRNATDKKSEANWHTPFERRHFFLSYAVKYWLRHAVYATPTEPSLPTTECCRQFLDDDEAVGLWAALYLAMSPDLTVRQGQQEAKPYEDQLVSLAIFAEHEAEELLRLAVHKHQQAETKGLSSAISDALIVAAGKGNLAMTKELMETSPKSHKDKLESALLGAIESGNRKVFSYIMGEVQQEVSASIQDWSRLLTRAASLNNTDAVKKILGRMKALSPSGTMPDMSPSPLLYASQRGFHDVVDGLGEGGLDVGASMSVAAASAVKFGTLVGLTNLFSCLPEDPEDDKTLSFYRDIIGESSRFGRRKPLQLVLSDMRQRLEQGTTRLGGDGSPIDLLDYITQSVIPSIKDLGHGANGEPAERELYRGSVEHAISSWPLAVDLIDLLTLPNNKLKEDDFSSTWVSWLGEAVKSGNLSLVRQVFENGERWDYATAEVRELAATKTLESIMQSGNAAFCLSYLIEKGANVNSRLSFGTTPLFRVAYQGLVKLARILIDNKGKVDIDAQGDGEWYPIHACYDNPQITKMLVEAGADIDVLTTDETPLPPLHFSVRWGHSAVVDELLKRPPNQESLRAGLKTAIIENETEIAEKLLQYCLDSSYLPDLDDMVHRQVRASNLDLLKALLEPKYQIDPNKRDKDGMTALHYVSQNTDVGLVKALVLRGGDIEARNPWDETLLTVAARLGNLPIVRYLVDECGALINDSSGFYGGPLHTACHLSTLEVVKVILHNKTNAADVNRIIPNIRGTPLQAALLRRPDTDDKLDIVRHLVLEAKANVNLASPFWGGALPLACLTSSVETMLLLIDKGEADINAKDHVDRTPLHFSLYRTKQHAETLLDRGADLKAVDVIKRNAMHFAVLSGRADLVGFVMEKWKQYVKDERPGFAGKELSEFVDQEDDHGWTPLLWALRGPSNWADPGGETKEIVQILLDNGARRLVRGRGGDQTWTPLKLAKYYAFNDDIVALLQPRPEDREKLSTAEREWAWENTGDKQVLWGDLEEGYCDHCLLGVHGRYYECIIPRCSFALCFSCYQSANKLHDESHEFTVSTEYETDVVDATVPASPTREDLNGGAEKIEDDFTLEVDEDVSTSDEEEMEEVEEESESESEDPGEDG